MRIGVYQKIPVLLVVDEGEVFGIVKRGVADLILVKAEIVMQKHPYIACLISLIVYLDPAEKYVVVARDGVAAADGDAKVVVT
jgi:hypothetical protein